LPNTSSETASHQCGEDELVRPVGRAAELTQAAVDQEAGRKEAERKADAERLQLERADVNFRLQPRES
jgi:hypothetical protein